MREPSIMRANGNTFPVPGFSALLDVDAPGCTPPERKRQLEELTDHQIEQLAVRVRKQYGKDWEKFKVALHRFSAKIQELA